ncbi:MAG TPA: histidine--tRNA ligase [Candidatus Saccharimonadales bacterium]|nr:histidine--tRNA ligase [Candidatus Saccharimonadales bacterium]
MIKPQTLKGFRDFLPSESKKRQYVITALKKVFESFGFDPLETPTLEYDEVLSGKYGEEGEKLMYRFEDNGGRKVAMRYDQTVPLARVIAQYSNDLPMPFKRYQIQPVFRAENTQKGRYREFIQCDIDIIGLDSAATDAEIIAVTIKSYENLGFKNFKVLVNDRSVFGDLPTKAIIIIDKLKKIGAEKVKEELSAKGFDPDVLSKIQNATLPDRLKLAIKVAGKMGIDKEKIVFEPTLARGLDYYTGTIIEVESPDYPTGSLGGGGRYDNLIGMFMDKKMPAVGFSFGFDRTIEAMEELKLFPQNLQTTKALVTIFSLELADKSMEICNMLRSNNINAEIYLDVKTKMEKQLKYADQKNIPYAVLLGPKEIEKNVVTIKNMKTREQKEIKIDQLTKELI